MMAFFGWANVNEVLPDAKRNALGAVYDKPTDLSKKANLADT
jgi:hypothetical protein